MSTHDQTGSNGFDLGAAPNVADLEEKGVAVQIRDIHGEPMMYRSEGGSEYPVQIVVAGSYSHRYRRAINAQTTRMLGRRAQKMTGELAQENRMEVISRCVISWSGFNSNGQPIPCTPENVKVVMERAPWIRDQVEAAMEDHEAFFKNSSGS